MQSRLTTKDQADLVRLEQVVHGAIRACEDAGAALLEIRERRLYKATHHSFEDYVFEKFQRTRGWANQQISWARVNTRVSTPTERHARPLAALPAPQQEEVWEAAVEEAQAEGRARPTVRRVEELVREIAQEVSPEAVHATRIERALEKVRAEFAALPSVAGRATPHIDRLIEIARSAAG